MGQGFAYARENNGTREIVVKDTTGKDIAMSAFSGYLAFSGNLLKEGLSNADAVIKGTLLGKVYSIVDGVISGVFDAHGNPDKSMNDVIGTSATAILVGEAGAGLGSLFGPVGTVIGGTIGGIAGAIWGEDAYNGIIDITSKAMDLADQAADFINDKLGFLNPNNEPQFLDNKATIPDDFSNPFGNLIKYDPIALDLDNDGKISIISTNDKSNQIYFDHDADGTAFRSSWIAPNDGILVYDRNQNGSIDNGSELFGNFTPNLSGNLANNGFEALANLDSNNDGIIDINDDEFVNLKVWIDKNSDGITQENELKTLSELEIKSLNLDAINKNENLGDKNRLILQGSYTKFDDTKGLAADIDFSVDTVRRKFTDKLNLTPEQEKRADVKGAGFLRDLKEACVLSENLANLIDEYSNLADKQSQINLLDNIILEWAKTNPNYNEIVEISKITEGSNSARDIYVTPTGYNSFVNDAFANLSDESLEEIKHKLAIINSFIGAKHESLYIATSNELNIIIEFDNSTYDEIKAYIYKSLLTQTRLKDYLNLIEIDISENTDTNGNVSFEFALNYDSVIAKFNEINSTDPKKAFIDLAEFIDLYKDKSTLGGLMTTLSGFANLAKANGVINEYLKLLSDETIKNLSTQQGTDNNDTLIGTGILNGIDTLYGNGGDDILIGGSGDDILIGGSGDDNLNGGSGSDTYEFSGDFGNDTIYNHDTSKDRYDTIKFTDNTTKEDLKFEKQSNNLIIKKLNSNNSITIADFFKDDTNLSYIINAVEFANGEKLSAEQIVDIIFAPTNGNDNLEMFFANKDYIINALGGDDTIVTKNGDDLIFAGSGDDTINAGAGNDTIFGESGNDNIYGGDGDDYINGGSGDDFLQGGQGNDTYIFDGKFDNDTVLNFKPNSNEIDTLYFSELKASELKFNREFDGKDFSSDLLIVTRNGSVRVQNFFDESSINESYKIDLIRTKDKTLNIDDIKQILTQKSIYNDNIQAFDGQIQINGGFGDDILKASKSGTILNGEAGNDTLISNVGNDTLYGGYGNDKYIYTRNGGSDTIWDNGGNDTLVLKGISATETKFEKVGNDLIILFDFNDDKITIQNHFKWLFGKPNRVENIVFDKDESIALADIDDFISNNRNKTIYCDLSDKFGTNISEIIEPNINKIAKELAFKFAEQSFNETATNSNISNNQNVAGANLSEIANSSLENSEFITPAQIDKIIEQVSAYKGDNGFGNFTFDDMKSAMNLQVYG